MTMTFSLHESIEPNHAFEHMEQWTESRYGIGRPVREEFHLISEKLRVPDVKHLVERPRLTGLVLRSQGQFPATLISGRAGTGKTSIAASIAAQHKSVAWYSVESTDTDWGLFARYFSASLSGASDGEIENFRFDDGLQATQNGIAAFLARYFSSASVSPADRPSLIVLDDIHHIFDAPWFADLFNLLLYSLPSETHLLLLCRSKPPSPLWRLRSKQMLNVLDEKVIAFNPAETEALFASLNLPPELAESANRDSFGRVSKLLEFARERSTNSPTLTNCLTAPGDGIGPLV